MAIINEAKIRVDVDAEKGKVSVTSFGKTIETAMKRGQVEAEKIKASFSKIGEMAQKFWFTFQSFRIIGAAARDAGELALKAKDVGAAFAKMVPPGFLERLRENVKGTISDFTLMQKTVEAMDLGATTQQLETFSKFARLEALRKGGNTAVRFGEIISGVLRGSTELLDNFGINLTQLNMKIEELAGDKKLTAVQRRALSVEAAVQIMNERMIQMGDITVQDSEKIAQLAASKENLRITIGRLLNNFLPLLDTGRKFLDWINNLNPKVITTVASLGLMVAVIAKVKMALISMQIAAGPVGWALAAIGLAASVLIPLLIKTKKEFNDLSGAINQFEQTISKYSIDTLKDQLIILEQQAEVEARAIERLEEDMDKYRKVVADNPNFKFAKTQLKQIEQAYESHNKKLNEIMAQKDSIITEMNQRMVTAAQSIIPEIEKAGEVAGEAFYTGFDKGIDKAEKDERKGWRKFEKEMRKLKRAIEGIDEGFENDNGVAREETPFEAWKRSLNDMQDIAKQSFDVIGNSMQMLSDRLTQALFNTKTKFKDLWVAMAMDFTRIFVNYVIAELAKFLAFKVFGNLLNIGLPGAGSVVSAVAAPIGGSIAGVSNLENQLVALNRNVQRISPTVNNNISSRQLYNAVKFEREKDLIRRGKDINNSLF